MNFELDLEFVSNYGLHVYERCSSNSSFLRNVLLKFVPTTCDHDRSLFQEEVVIFIN